MMQLENAASSPWEIKGSEPQNQTPIQWTKVTEETEEKKPEPPQPKYDHRYACWDIPGVGTGAIILGPLSVALPQEIRLPLPDKGVLIFSLNHIDKDGDGRYKYEGIEL
jgi:hypothetical protein